MQHLTLAVSRAQEPQRHRSGGCWASAPLLCSARTWDSLPLSLPMPHASWEGCTIIRLRPQFRSALPNHLVTYSFSIARLIAFKVCCDSFANFLRMNTFSNFTTHLWAE